MRSCCTLRTLSPMCYSLGLDLHAWPTGGLENLCNALGLFWSLLSTVSKNLENSYKKLLSKKINCSSSQPLRILGLMDSWWNLSSWKNFKRNSFYLIVISSFLRVYFYLDPEVDKVVKIDLKCNWLCSRCMCTWVKK